jgi:hypothetical protein
MKPTRQSALNDVYRRCSTSRHLPGYCPRYLSDLRHSARNWKGELGFLYQRPVFLLVLE